MKRFCILISIFVLVLVYSCDKQHSISYVVTNESDSRIKVVYNLMYSMSKDTSIFVSSKSKATIYIREIDYGRFVSNPEEDNDTIWAFTKFLAYNNDSIQNTTDLKLASRWKYKTINDNNAELNIEITDADFK